MRVLIYCSIIHLLLYPIVSRIHKLYPWQHQLLSLCLVVFLNHRLIHPSSVDSLQILNPVQNITLVRIVLNQRLLHSSSLENVPSLLNSPRR